MIGYSSDRRSGRFCVRDAVLAAEADAQYNEVLYKALPNWPQSVWLCVYRTVRRLMDVCIVSQIGYRIVWNVGQCLNAWAKTSRIPT